MDLRYRAIKQKMDALPYYKASIFNSATKPYFSDTSQPLAWCPLVAPRQNFGESQNLKDTANAALKCANRLSTNAVFPSRRFQSTEPR